MDDANDQIADNSVVRDPIAPTSGVLVEQSYAQSYGLDDYYIRIFYCIFRYSFASTSNEFGI